MSIHETINQLEDIKQQDLNQAASTARGGLVHARELRGWIDAFDKHLQGLPFNQIEGKLQDVAATADTGETQGHDTGDKLMRTVGNTDNEHAQEAIRSAYNIGNLMGVTYWDRDLIGVKLAVEKVQEGLTELQEMASAMREKMEGVKGLAQTIEIDFTMIAGPAAGETILKKMIRWPVLEKSDSLVGQIGREITAYQQHLSK